MTLAIPRDLDLQGLDPLVLVEFDSLPIDQRLDITVALLDPPKTATLIAYAGLAAEGQYLAADQDPAALYDPEEVS